MYRYAVEAAFLAYTAVAYSTPSPAQLGHISILASNNLRTSDAQKTSAGLLLRTPRTQASASEACAALGESLWSPSKEYFNAGLNNSLSYESYAGYSRPDQLFWVASENSSSRHGCKAMDVNGACHTISCNAQLPALCTQSAPASNSTFSDTSTRFRVAQSVGEQTLVGFRDFYTFRFLGVRFAEEPERFTYSSTFTNATGTNLALKGAQECLQAPNNGSTDCLFLNIWTPVLPGADFKKEELRPVMVYIYGGGFATGSASNPTNDGGNQASRGDVVVVDIAYRLNSLGFLALDDSIHNGNYWMSDLISGLQWIQQYITAFGGDPEKIMIYGESAGAESVQALLASPKAIGLFRAALMQSNYLQPYTPISDAFNQTTKPILHETGCAKAKDQLACLQAYNATALINLKTNFNFPVVDGTYLVSEYINLNASVADNVSSSVPVISGVNRNEAGVLIPLPSSSKYTKALHELAASQGQDKQTLNAILNHRSDFPLGIGPSLNNTPLNQVFNTTVRIYTDTDFHCSDEFTVLAGVHSGIWPKAWYYEFNRTYQDPGYNMNGVCQAPVTKTHPHGDPSLDYFKCHAGDLANTFGTVTYTGFPERDQYDIPFGQLAVDYWTSFARTLDPNPDPGYLRARGYWDTLDQITFSGPWEPVDENQPMMMELQWNSVMMPFTDPVQCAILGQPLDYLL